MYKLNQIDGCGLGLRSEFLFELQSLDWRPDWFEITPENWIAPPWHFREPFEILVNQIPTLAHGLSLSIGSPDPLDTQYLKTLKSFLDKHNIEHYSEHLSFSILNGNNTFELLPLPLTERKADEIVNKLKQSSELLERPIIVENATTYFSYEKEISESEFINIILERSGMPLLLDINNVYVNSQNYGFDPGQFISEINTESIAYYHIAGHTWYEEDQMIIDTHGENVIEPVWELARQTLKRVLAPVLLERDNNIPPLGQLISEYNKMKELYQSVKTSHKEFENLQREKK